MATVNRGTIFVARSSFNVWDAGRLVTFRRGKTTIRAGHPLLEGREDRFRPFEVTYDVAPGAVPPAAPAKPAAPMAALATAVHDAPQEPAGPDTDVTG